MNPNNLLTIAIPVYNDAGYIAQAVESCLCEAGTIIIYDNCSTDGTSDICARYAQTYDHVRHIRHTKNLGAYHNMRLALEAAKTPYFSFVGAHDKLTPGYSAPLVQALENNSNLQLACGRIQHIDEQDNPLPTYTCADWINLTRNMTALARTGIFVSKLRDCFLFYGIFRTDAARAAWCETPMLGFDRVVLLRTAANGPIAYVPESTFLARDFPKTRNSRQDRERRAQEIGETAILKSNFLRNHKIAETVLSLATNDDELTQAFGIIDRLNRRLHNRRFYQRQRLVHIALTAALIALFAFLVVTR